MPLCLWMRCRSLDCSYVVFKWLIWCLTAPSSWLKTEFLICGRWFPTGILLYIEVWLLGNSSFYLVVGNHRPDRYILYRRKAINQFSQRVGLENYYSNYLAICRYIKLLFQSWIKYFEKLNYSTRLFPVVLIDNIERPVTVSHLSGEALVL